ncbi:phytanoyl-CoA dioxygenase family protein [Rubritalea tangerina]|uniref:Phytanoyl-CoA dioxygenase family protein n=2 Tax=Rubritalea tangerina TaxID=430798 RepID=A0ABW4ZBH7_9BACT
MEGFKVDGFAVFTKVLEAHEIERLRRECDGLAEREGKVCVRRVAEKSELVMGLAHAEKMRQFLPADYLLVRSILFDKTADSNWPVLWHQDLTIMVRERVALAGYGPWSQKAGAEHVQPPVEVLQQMLTLRVHLDPTPAENGALRVIQGSHRLGKLDPGEVAGHVGRGDEVVCACDAGDVLMMSPLLLHASARSSEVGRRRVLHFEYAHRDALDEALEWA